MAYTSFTQNDLAKWWVIGTGSAVNRLSEVMDDSTLGPCIQQLDAADAWQANGATTDEFIIAQATKPDSVWENLSGWRQMTNVADDTAEDALNADEWTWYTDGWTVVRLSDDSDPNATDMREFYAWTTFMTEIVENQMYKIHRPFDIGNGTTATTLTTKSEMIYYDAECNFLVKANATYTDGTKISSTITHEGSMIIINDTDGTATWYSHYGTLNLYGTKIHVELSGSTTAGWKADGIYFRGSGEFINADIGYKDAISFITNYTLTNVIFGKVWNGIWVQADAVTLTSPTVISNSYGFRSITNAGASYLISPVFSVSQELHDNNAYAHTIYLRDYVGSIRWTGTTTMHANTIWYQQYSVNIHVSDRAGVDLSGVTVDCEDKNTTAAWTAGTITTDANGDITQQWVNYKTYVSGDFASGGTIYSPHKFTLSKAGYETLILENVTVDAPIAWHLELQHVGGAKNKQIGLGVNI